MNNLRHQRAVTKTYAGGDEHGAELCAVTTAHPTVTGTVANAKLTARQCAGELAGKHRHPLIVSGTMR